MSLSVQGSGLAATTLQDRSRLAPAGAQGPDQSQSQSQSQPSVVVLAGVDRIQSSQAALTRDGLVAAKGVLDAAVGAGRGVGQALLDMREAVRGALDPQRAVGVDGLAVAYQRHLTAIDRFAAQANFHGRNLVDGEAADPLRFALDGAGAEAVLEPADLTADGATVDLADSAVTGDPAWDAKLLDRIDAALRRVSDQVDALTAQASQLDSHFAALSRLGEAQSAGESDLDAEGAKLRALDVRQALADQAASIAAGTQAVLALLRA